MIGQNQNNKETIKQLKCIKCGSRNKVIALPHFHSTSKSSATGRRTTITSSHLLIPLCKDCKEGYMNSNKYRDNAQLYLVGTILCVGLVIFFGTISYGANFYMLLAGLSIIYVPGIFCAINNYIKMNKVGINPKKYLKYKGHGNLMVKPDYAQDWIPYNEWISDAIDQRSSEIFESALSNSNACAFCGNLLKRTNKFCSKCGRKNLNYSPF